MMITRFPKPYPDELLYSIFARYHLMVGNTSPKSTTEDLFERRTVRSVWDLPANLTTVFSQIGSYWNVEEIILKHTMYPYYVAFLLPDQAEQVKEAMMGEKGSTIHTRIGASASNVKSKTNLWTCEHCIKEDVETLGETYWRRTHQAPGVFFCPSHQITLSETNVPIKADNQHEYIVATPYIERTQVDFNYLHQEEIDLLIKIAKGTEALLSSLHQQKNENDIKDKYTGLLKQRGYASARGFVKRQQLYQSFRSTFSKQILSLLQSEVIFKESDWLTMIFQKHRKSFHPIRHLLIMLFLETNLDHLFEIQEYHPFGKGPWICLNKACPDYNKPVITSLNITSCYDTRKPVGTFHCNCGFIFSRRGPDRVENDRYRIGTIKEYGHVWMDKLRELVNQGKSLTEISKELEADRATVKKYAAKMNLKVSWKLPKFEEKKLEEINVEKELTNRRNRWIDLQETYPEKSKTELRRIAPDVFAYLYRNDKEWLDSNSPAKKKIVQPNYRVNWDERDEVILSRIKEVVESWDSGVEKITRITPTSIGKKINQLPLIQKKAEKIPRTIEYIKQIEEDIETFQMRRVEFIIEQLKKNDERILEWEIYRKAGLRDTVSDKVKRLITLKVNEYEHV